MAAAYHRETVMKATDSAHRGQIWYATHTLAIKVFFFRYLSLALGRYFTILYLKFKLFGINLESSRGSGWILVTARKVSII